VLVGPVRAVVPRGQSTPRHPTFDCRSWAGVPVAEALPSRALRSRHRRVRQPIEQVRRSARLQVGRSSSQVRQRRVFTYAFASRGERRRPDMRRGRSRRHRLAYVAYEATTDAPVPQLVCPVVSTVDGDATTAVHPEGHDVGEGLSSLDERPRLVDRPDARRGSCIADAPWLLVVVLLPVHSPVRDGRSCPGD